MLDCLSYGKRQRGGELLRGGNNWCGALQGTGLPLSADAEIWKVASIGPIGLLAEYSNESAKIGSDFAVGLSRSTRSFDAEGNAAQVK